MAKTRKGSTRDIIEPEIKKLPLGTEITSFSAASDFIPPHLIRQIGFDRIRSNVGAALVHIANDNIIHPKFIKNTRGQVYITGPRPEPKGHKQQDLFGQDADLETMEKAIMKWLQQSISTRKSLEGELEKARALNAELEEKLNNIFNLSKGRG